MQSVFRMPTPVKLVGRTSSITNSFVNGIVPCIMPSAKEVQTVLNILGMTEETIKCAYCGDRYTEWDHFFPLIKDKRQTGYISEIHNLVPACGKCNQSKGNSYWKEWILGNAKLSPKSRNVDNLKFIIMRLENYENWTRPTIVDFEKIVGKEKWDRHWENCEKLHGIMRESQKLSDEIKITLAQKIGKGTSITNVINVNHTEIEVNDRLKKVGILAQTKLVEILESPHISASQIKLLQSKEYSKETFGLNFPLLKEINYTKSLEEQKKDHTGINRYYKEPVIILGKKYLLCSQWYIKNRPHLIKWIDLQYK